MQSNVLSGAKWAWDRKKDAEVIPCNTLKTPIEILGGMPQKQIPLSFLHDLMNEFTWLGDKLGEKDIQVGRDDRFSHMVLYDQ